MGRVRSPKIRRPMVRLTEFEWKMMDILFSVTSTEELSIDRLFEVVKESSPKILDAAREELLKAATDSVNVREKADVPTIPFPWPALQKVVKVGEEYTVRIDDYGYPFVLVSEKLYNFNKHVPLAEKGEKVRVLFFKED